MIIYAGTPDAWIQVQMTEATPISGIMTRGGGHYNEWVTSFKIQYGNSTNALATIQDKHRDKVCIPIQKHACIYNNTSVLIVYTHYNGQKAS